MKVTLAKALKLKKRVVERISKVTQEIQTYNQAVGYKVLNSDGTTKVDAKFQREVDVKKALDERELLKGNLVMVKVAINRANQKQQDHLLQLAELKDSLTFYRSLPVRNGEELAPSYRGTTNDNTTVVVYDSVVTKADVDKKVSDLQKQLDQLQETVEGFNWKTHVDLPDMDF